MLRHLGQKITQSFFRQNYIDGHLPRGKLAPAQAKVMRFFEKLPPIHKMPPWLARKTYITVDHLFSINKIPLDKVLDHHLGHIIIREYQDCRHDPAQAKQPALVYFHGGGCAIGNLESHDLLCRYIAHKTGYIVLSVNYRLGPEHKFPAAVEDALASWNWVVENAGQLGINIDQTGVGGDSAGGYLATLICQQAIESTIKPEPAAMPCYQWLIYPMMDLRGLSDSYNSCTSGMLLTQDLMNYFRDHYLNSPEDRNNPLASPILVEDLSALPRSYVLTVGHDPLMDDGLKYAEDLLAQGCMVAHDHFEHLMHGFISFGGVCPYALDAIDQAIDQLMKLKIASHRSQKQEERYSA